MEVQEAIEKIGKEVNGLTILIIAHRLTTIASANNLLFFRNRSQLDYASKGSREYTEIFENLKNIAYSYGDSQPDGQQERLDDSQSDNDMIVEESQEEDKDEYPPFKPKINTLASNRLFIEEENKGEADQESLIRSSKVQVAD
jgi:hypothetical protein